uniref:Cell division cycle protein 20 homolog n=1 Tax=Athene cunicularia TaxID=194338 RepID=A0A663MEY3_ATHCN
MGSTGQGVTVVGGLGRAAVPVFLCRCRLDYPECYGGAAALHGSAPGAAVHLPLPLQVRAGPQAGEGGPAPCSGASGHPRTGVCSQHPLPRTQQCEAEALASRARPAPRTGQLPPRKQQARAGEGAGAGPSAAETPPGPMNRSHSFSKTPSRTPGKSGSKIQSTPTKAGGDRYIPNRSAMQMEMANFLLTKENDPAEESPTKKEQQKAWAVNLNGFDIEEAKILRLTGKPQNAPEGYQNNLKVLYSQKGTPGSSKKNGRYIPSMPDRILDAPEIRNDYYLNLIDWSSQNFLAVALDNSVYLWNHASGEIIQLLQMEHPDDYVSSVSWIKEGNYLAVGTSNAEVQLWDIQHQKRLRNMTSHSSRVGSLSWNSYILSSGARTGHIHHHDVRVAEHHVATLAGHTQEVCGLKWSLDGRYLASGGNDNLVNIWPCTQGDSGHFAPLHTFTQHQGAVKAVSWCPWQSNVLATGGGTSDRHIRIWNVCSGSCLSICGDKHLLVCSILWSTNYKEFISGHGFAQNQLVIWKYPTMAKVTELRGHTARVLNLTMSPDGATVASAAADETLRLWRCFELDPIKKKEKEKANSVKSSIIHQGIR